MEKFQTALQRLSQQNDIFVSSPTTYSPIFKTNVHSKNLKCKIPDDLVLDNLYNPKYTVVQLMSTRNQPRKLAIPPRPPNSFFLFKNCYTLELRKLGYRYRMPDVCRQSKQIWSNAPSDVKERYEIISLQAQILHHEMYPEYKFSPTKKNKKEQNPSVLPPETVVDSSMFGTFSLTNFLGYKTIENTANSEPFQLPSSQTTQTISSSPIISSTYESINTMSNPELIANFADYNNLFYNYNYYLNSLNSQSTTSSPIDINTIYSQILNPVESLLCSNNQNTLINFT